MKYLSPEQIAERLGVSRATGYRIADEIGTVIVDGANVVSIDSWERHIAANSILPRMGRPNAVQHPLLARLSDEVIAATNATGQCCSRAGWTYLIEGAERIKIGRSDAAITSRILAIQACSPVPLAVVAVGRDSTFERRLHLRFGNERRHGEWFVAAKVRRRLADAIETSKRDGICLRCAMEGRE